MYTVAFKTPRTTEASTWCSGKTPMLIAITSSIILACE